MATDIAPSLGQGAVLLQAGPGATPGYSAIDVRRALSTGLQEGVIDSGSYEVTQRAAGANMSVDIAASTGEGAWVQGDTVAAQGLYFIAPHSTVINETITANADANARVDQVILEILDDTHDAGALNKARIRVLTGSTAVAGATLDNRTGAAALPNGAIRLADVLVAAGAVSVSNSSIRDRRPWARGAYNRIIVSSGGNKTIASATPAALDSTNLNPRIECSGAPVRVVLRCRHSNSGAGNFNIFELRVDGATSDMGTLTGGVSVANTNASFAVMTFDFVPSAGSHRFAPYWSATAGTGTVNVSSGVDVIELTVEELVRQNTANNSTTTG